MAYDLRTPRSRGSLCGLALILLGGWAAIAPFAGPSLGFGFTPDLAWHYTAGRLYLSVVPGVVVLLGGLIIALSRSRWFGGFCAFVAAVAGLWLIAGAALIRLLPASQVASITTGNPFGTSVNEQIFARVAFFSGAGALIVFFAALALGRFSIAAARDYGGAPIETPDGIGVGGAGAAYGAFQSGSDATTQQTYPGSQQYGSQYQSGQDPFHTGQYQAGVPYPSATEKFPQGAGQYPAPDASQGPFGLTQDWPAAGQQDPSSPAP